MLHTIKETFRAILATIVAVHWDGKLLHVKASKSTGDRLAISVSGYGVNQLLAVSKLPNGTGLATANAVHAALEDWGIVRSVCAMAFDTTSSNTGNTLGACILLESKLGKPLPPFACRNNGTVFIQSRYTYIKAFPKAVDISGSKQVSHIANNDPEFVSQVPQETMNCHICSTSASADITEG